MGLFAKLFRRGGGATVAEPPEAPRPAAPPILSEADQAHARETIERELEAQRAKMEGEGGSPSSV